MKKIITVLLIVFAGYGAEAQSIGIGTTNPNASAQLDVTSINKGLLIPRMTTLQRTGIATPANGLMVYDITLSAFYFYNGSSGSWNAVNSGGGGSNNWAASGNNIYNSNTGNVGIGSGTGLKEKLSVKGNLFVTFTNPNDLVNGGNRAALNLHGANTGGARINFLNSDTSVGAHITYYRFTSQLNEFSLNHGSNSRQINLHENGNVGIGKIPTEKLDVNGTIRSREDVIVDNNVTAAGKIEGAGLVSTAGLTVANASIFGSGVFGVTTAQFTGEITSNTGITINDAAGTLTLKNSTDDKGFVQLSGDDLRVGTFSSNAAGKFHIRTGGSNNLTVTGDGNVGIGTLNPSAKLHVAGRTYIRGNGEVLTIDGTSNPNIAFYNSGLYKSFISQSPSELFIGVNNAKLHLDASQIAIGGVIDAASAYKLTVTGKIICEELKVQLQDAWPDYVFEKKYDLMPLSQLRNFIQDNNHLPNIPAAASIQKEGIEVGEMQRKMMEKIEELTLYILQLEEKVNSLLKK